MLAQEDSGAQMAGQGHSRNSAPTGLSNPAATRFIGSSSTTALKSPPAGRGKFELNANLFSDECALRVPHNDREYRQIVQQLDRFMDEVGEDENSAARMSRDEIKQTIDDFLLLVEKGCGSVDENEKRLKFLLDKLAFAQHFVAYKFDEKDYAEVPEKTYEELRKLVTAKFPNYGSYNIAEDVTKNIGDGKAIVGDAIDDIADIAGDLFETK